MRRRRLNSRSGRADLADQFERIYRDHASRVFMLALRLTGDPVDAADVSADAFARAWGALPRFRGDSGPFTWLHSLTVRAWRDWQRARYRHDRIVLETASAAEASPYSLAAQYDGRDDLIDLERAIATLPDGAREVLILRTFTGHSHQEIAALLGVSVGTVKSQLHRARQLLLRGGTP